MLNNIHYFKKNIKYSLVKVENEGVENFYYVYGHTTPVDEAKKLLKNSDMKSIPKIQVVQYNEKRRISLEDFIKFSEIEGGNE